MQKKFYTYEDSISEDLINAGFDREFIKGLTLTNLYNLHIAWDVEDPDEQWKRVESFFMLSGIDYDYEKVFQ